VSGAHSTSPATFVHTLFVTFVHTLLVAFVHTVFMAHLVYTVFVTHSVFCGSNDPVGKKLLRTLGWREHSNKPKFNPTSTPIPPAKHDNYGIAFDAFKNAPEFEAARAKRETFETERHRQTSVYRMSDLQRQVSERRLDIPRYSLCAAARSGATFRLLYAVFSCLCSPARIQPSRTALSVSKRLFALQCLAYTRFART